mmetsp:Transcript_91767/g.259076  ORF Transcript_91767/g.259076 Transcript_91767/m.259076 type:complete len:239 (-) Transcript_91767:557-1273(-)
MREHHASLGGRLEGKVITLRRSRRAVCLALVLVAFPLFLRPRRVRAPPPADVRPSGLAHEVRRGQIALRARQPGDVREKSSCTCGRACLARSDAFSFGTAGPARVGDIALWRKATALFASEVRRRIRSRVATQVVHGRGVAHAALGGASTAVLNATCRLGARSIPVLAPDGQSRARVASARKGRRHERGVVVADQQILRRRIARRALRRATDAETDGRLAVECNCLPVANEAGVRAVR